MFAATSCIQQRIGNLDIDRFADQSHVLLQLDMEDNEFIDVLQHQVCS